MYIMCSCGNNPNWLPVGTLPDGRQATAPCPFCGLQHFITKETPIAHCWGANCYSNLIHRVGLEDGPYGHYCTSCGNSLRLHPFFGENRVYDMGNPASWNLWKSLTPQQKIEVYIANGFRAPTHLIALVNSPNQTVDNQITPEDKVAKTYNDMMEALVSG